MRYFLNTSAARPVVAGGITFTFELVGLRGGSWLGVLAVADDAAASILAETRPANTEEIDEATYDRLKKKSTAPTSRNSLSPATPPNPSLAIAAPAARRIEPTIAKPTPILTPVTLLTTKATPPVEQLLAKGHRMKRPV